MFVNFGLPSPDGSVLLWVVVFAGALTLAAVVVWRRDRRRVDAERDAVPRPVSETDTAPCHGLPGCTGSPRSGDGPSGSAPAAQAEGSNVQGRGHQDSGAIAQRLWRTVVEVARVLPRHSFRVEVLHNCRGLSVEEPAFSLSLAALLLHAAQFGRSHFVELAPLAPEHPMYRRGSALQLIVHVTTDLVQPGLPSHLADRAIDGCRLAGGTGSAEDDNKLWLIWPTSRHPADLVFRNRPPSRRPRHAVPS